MSQSDDSEPSYSDDPDQTNPKTRHSTSSDDRDDDAEDRSAEDEDANAVQSEVEEIGQQVGLDDESVDPTEADAETESTDSAGGEDDGLPDFDDFEGEGDGGGDTDSASGGGATTASAASGGAATGDSPESGTTDGEIEDAGEEGSEPEGFGDRDMDRPEGQPPSQPEDLGPTDPETIQEEFDLDFSETTDHFADHSEYEYEVLNYEQRKKIRQHIKREHGDDAWNTIRDLTSEWKGTSDGVEASQFEAIAKEALGVDAQIRLTSDEEFPQPTDEEVAAYRDLSRISQGFLKEKYADANGQIAIRRGVPRSRGEATSDLTRQMFENPDADEVTLETSVLSNHTPAKGTADYFEDVYSVSYRTDVSNVGYMPGIVRHTIQEAEMHVAGGGVQVPKNGAGSSKYDRSFNDLSTAIQNPEAGDYDTHETLKKGIKSMRQDGGTVKESTAKKIIRYGYQAEGETNVHTKGEVRRAFTRTGSPMKIHEKLYHSYDPETDTFDN